MFSGVLAEIYKQFCQLTGKAYNELEGKIANAFHKYEKNYRERHGTIKVFCVGMRKPIQLDDVYVTVQVSGDRSRSSYRSPDEVEMAFRYRNRPIPSADALEDGTIAANEKQYLMVLGGPGVGKSTFLRKVGLEALKEKNGNFEHKCIPVFLELKRFTADQINIETLITEEFRTCGFPDPEQMTEEALKSGKLLILFDGLDEVPAANVDNVVSKIGDFVDRYSQNRFIASCRVAAYKGGFRRFTDVEMAEFDDTQIERYIKNWFDSTPDHHRRHLDTEIGTAQKCLDRLSEAEHAATKELARNPLLLTLLCMVYDNLQNFPRNRVDLYERALSIFLEEWAAEKRIRREELISQYLDIAAEKRMLSEIAVKNFAENRLFFSKDELIYQIQKFGEGDANTPPTFNASKILETILVDQGLFVEQVSGSYSFSHLTFQEYLTANYIVKDTQSIQELVTEHLHDRRWREVFLLIAGGMREADGLLKAMEAEAAKCISTDGLKRLFGWAEHITDTMNGKNKGTAKRGFAIRQYWSLWLLNIIREEEIKNGAREDRRFDVYFDLYLYFDLNSYLDLDPGRNFDFDFYFYQNLYQDLYLYRDLYQDRNFDLYFYLNNYLDLYFVPYLDLHLYFDFYCYMDVDLYVSISSRFEEPFNRELKERIAFVDCIAEAKIFKGVDLQQIVRRFKTQQSFIKAVRKHNPVEPPKESIHDTWLSVLQITDEMLTISREELENYKRYLRAVELIIACKEASGRVSIDVWNDIEKRFLTPDAAEIKA